MKYTFKVEIETNDYFAKNINRTLEWNRKYNPGRTFEKEVESSLGNIIMDAIMNDSCGDINEVKVKMLLPISEQELEEMANDYIESICIENKIIQRLQDKITLSSIYEAGYCKAVEEGL